MFSQGLFLNFADVISYIFPSLPTWVREKEMVMGC